jgi:phosphoribosyl-AMP cyclohydrolase
MIEIAVLFILNLNQRIFCLIGNRTCFEQKNKT